VGTGLYRIYATQRLRTRPYGWERFYPTEENVSRPVSRVLCAGLARVMAIHLGRALPRASCNQPGRRSGNGPKDSRLQRRLSPSCRPYSVLLPVGFAVPRLLPAARCALTAPFHPYPRKRGRFAFCGTFPGVAPAGRYPAPCFHGARTFLRAVRVERFRPTVTHQRGGHPAG